MKFLCEITCEEPLINESEILSASVVIPDGDNWGIWWRKKLRKHFGIGVDERPRTSFKGLSLKITNNETGETLCSIGPIDYDASTKTPTRRDDDINLEASQTDH